MKNKSLKILTIIFTVLLVVILFTQIQIDDIIKTLININPWYILLGFVLYVLNYFFRTLRLYVLLNEKVGIKDLFTITCIHNMTNNILPARTGEMSYIYLLKKYHDRTTGEGAATLITARAFDIITIALFFLLSAVLVRNLPNIMMKALWAIAFITSIVVIALLILLYRGDSFIRMLKKTAVHFKLDKRRFVDYIFQKVDEMMESFSCMRPRQFIWVTLLSIGIWFTLYSINYVLVTAMGLNLAFEAVLLASTFALITTLLPLQGIMGFGTIEGGWVIGFMGSGVAKEVAISSGFSVHIISIFYFMILGLMGLIAQTKK